VIRDHSGENIEGKIFYKSAPNRMKFVLQYSTGEKIIKYVTADSEIIYIPDKNIAIKSLPSKDVLSNSPTVVMDYVNTDQAEVTEDNQFYYYKIYLPVPENLLINDEIPVVMKTHINKRHYYTERIIFLNKKGEEIQVQELKNYKLNISIDDREFNFSPPQGCKFVFRQEQ
jgi:outer membrane lipoprotein-sorting protein